MRSLLRHPVTLIVLVVGLGGGIYWQVTQKQRAQRRALEGMIGMLGRPAGRGFAVPPQYFTPYREEAIPLLLQVLHAPEKGAAARAHAATTLGVLKSQEAVPALAEAAGDEEATVSEAAIAALGQLGTEAAAQALLGLLDTSPHRAAVVKALGEARAAAAREKLLTYLDAEDVTVAQAAAVALGQIGGSGVVEALLKHLNTPSLRRACTLGLLHQRHEKGLAAALRMLMTDKPEAREELIQALAGMGEPGVPLLLRALPKAPDAAKCGLINALGRIRSSQAVEALLEAVHSKNSGVVLEAAKALGQIGDARAIQALLPLLGHSNPAVRTNVETALSDLGDSAVDPLVQILRTPSQAPTVRARAARTLGVLRREKAVEALIAALEDAEPEVRAQAALALGMMSEDRALPALEQMAQDPDQEVQRAVRRAIQLIRVSQ